MTSRRISDVGNTVGKPAREVAEAIHRARFDRVVLKHVCSCDGLTGSGAEHVAVGSECLT